MMRNLIALMIFSLPLCVAGCVKKVSPNSPPNIRGERLAIERGKLNELSDPIARTKSYVVITDIILTFIADAATDEDHDSLRALLSEYAHTLATARDTVVNSGQGARRLRAYAELDTALRRQIRTLQTLKPKVSADDREPLDQAIQSASSIHEEIARVSSRSGM